MYDNSQIGTKEIFKSDWSGFRNKALELAKQSNYAATTDIVDFFPRVYLHRLENAIDAIGNDTHLTRAIMKMIKSWANGTSYGIPTGLHASNLFSEALLVEVDEFLLSKDVEYIRHDDDFVIFGDSVADCQEGIWYLGERLHKTQGLSLNMAKTDVYDSDLYKMGSEGIREKIIEDILDGNPYADIEWEDLTTEEKEEIAEIDPSEVVESELENDVVDQKTMKVILRVIAANPDYSVVSKLLRNLERLLPVADDVARVLMMYQDKSNLVSLGKEILDFLGSGEFVTEYQSVWLLEPFTMTPDWNNLDLLRKIAETSQHSFVRRQAILGLGVIGDRSSLLDHKSRIHQVSSWEYRAILYALRSLPTDEFDAFIRTQGGFRGTWDIDNVLNKAVMKYAKDV